MFLTVKTYLFDLFTINMTKINIYIILYMLTRDPTFASGFRFLFHLSFLVLCTGFCCLFFYLPNNTLHSGERFTRFQFSCIFTKKDLLLCNFESCDMQKVVKHGIHISTRISKLSKQPSNYIGYSTYIIYVANNAKISHNYNIKFTPLLYTSPYKCKYCIVLSNYGNFLPFKSLDYSEETSSHSSFTSK